MPPATEPSERSKSFAPSRAVSPSDRTTVASAAGSAPSYAPSSSEPMSVKSSVSQNGSR